MKLILKTITYLKTKQSDLLFFIKHSSYTEIVSKINFLSLVLLIFAIPFNRNHITFFIGLWTLTWLIQGNFIKRLKKNVLSKHQKRIFFLFIIFYLFHVISYFFSENKSVARFDLEVKFSIILFPIIMLITSKIYKDKWLILLKAFVFGLVISSVIYLLVALFKSFSIKNGCLVFNTAFYEGLTHLNFFELIKHRFSKFSYVHLSIWHHPSYYAMFLNVGIAINYFLYKKNKLKKQKIWNMVGILFFVIMIYLLTSRAGILSLISIFLFISILEIRGGEKSSKYVLIPIVIFFVLLFMNNSKLKTTIIDTWYEITKEKETEETKEATQIKEIKKVKEVTEIKGTKEVKDKKKQKKQKKQKAARLMIWNHAMLVAQEKPWFGVGIGDIKQHLIESYKHNNYIDGVKLKLNTHNQYLETLIGGGFTLLILLLLMLGYSIYYAINNRKILLFMFLLNIIINFAFESMLNTMDGVIFIILFWIIFILEKYNTPLLENKKNN